MSQFLPLEGIITSVRPMQTTINDKSACTIKLTLLVGNREVVHLVVDPSSYILNQEQLQKGSHITAYYDSMAPVPLIYPPQYNAIAIVPNRKGQMSTLDFFDSNLLNSDGTLQLEHSRNTSVQLQNGQKFLGTLGDQILLVLYGATTRSIPARTTPSQIIVFCNPA